MKQIIFTNSKDQRKRLEKQINKMEIPTPSVDIKFTMMQKLFAYWLKEKHFYGNWSGTGVGKTYSFILASRVIDAHLTIVIGTNSTTNQLAGEITNLYNDSIAVVYDGELPDFDMSKHNYLIFNYDKGQQKYSKTLFDSILDKYHIDYLVFDEVQLIKQTGKNSSTRRKNFKYLRDKAVGYYNSYVSVLTATPYTNSIFEVISILSFMTGNDYSNLPKKNILKNTIAVENLLNSLGVCSNTKAKNIHGKVIEENVHTDVILGEDSTFENFKECINQGPLAIYQSTLNDKLEYLFVVDKIKKGELTIIYTQFTDGIVEQTKDFFTNYGFRVCEYTGTNKDTDPYKNEYGKVDWSAVKNDYDIILASRPIATGVDGLQTVCNKMVILTLPWTYAEYNQLVGRIKRKMSFFDKVDICIPIVKFPQSNYVGYDDKVWCSIQNKAIFSDACMNGVFPKEDKTIHKTIIESMNNDIINYKKAA